MKHNFFRQQKQKGSVLIISLMFLIGLSLIAVASIKTGNLNLKIISNEGKREDLRFEIQQAIEQMISVQEDFVIATQDITINGQLIKMTKQCMFSFRASGYGANFAATVGGDLDDPMQGLTPIDTIWRITATAKDSSNLSAGAIQGIKVRMLASGC